ncbi:SGNH/GDSL hydrolase family protein [Azohydromonas caseinilytica]|uniref:GDSL family lipase n=1 Tax=Azohydromonas caseinilytica TaxID=2728836 RepID=A0A848F9D5_9BURK|nr:SGNH/GDSL hydrolase family protein [Azohydromonas caseinilytica]NML15952.1 GDSL family lipase [Azohydromonas caseinilytica]
MTSPYSRSRRRFTTFALLGTVLPAWADEAPLSSVAPRWRASFAAFEAADRARPVAPGGVVFVGSSSIRGWENLETQFDLSPPPLNRGFGGSTLAECARHLDRLVLPYRPRLVVLYAGDNDLAAGDTPRQVLNSYLAFVDGVHRALPATRIAFIAIKPSPSRARLLHRVRQANMLVRHHAAGDARLAYIDVFTPMLGPDGQPRPQLFQPDALHLNARGYALWRELIAPVLR